MGVELRILLPEIINTGGLVLNMVGVLLVFFFGYPQPSHEEGVSIGLRDTVKQPDGRTIKKYNEDIRKQKSRYLMLSKLGLGLLGVGFGFQLWATWLE